ncbi:hypothetical protein OESDEN_02280 [Oesophagostomum dentatum]|uniref:Uncharacterized protein n=1 Tax=Oesophagostomum dentatum TaxID=61180 RepID=A0A0B1TPK0_OESDE|nr:hypothetical protein OESDEN_02280 [Oesophagostomum dentatum]
MDPFGAAPFDPLCGQVNPEEESEMISCGKGDEDSVGSASDLRGRTMDEDSEQDEQRMVARRRFSYENIDGVGDDASSDSRGRTDHDSTDDISKNEESSYDEFNGECESSQHTDVADATSDDDGTGSRPLLEDDALDDDEEGSFSGLSSSQEQLHLRDATKSLFIDPNLENVVLRKNTNPFLVSTSDETPKISPVMPTVVGMSSWIEKDSVVTGSGYDEVQRAFFPVRPLPQQPNTVGYVYAPATLPRQSTPLTAAPRFMPRPVVPAEALSVLEKPLPLTSLNPVVTTTALTNACQNPVLPNIQAAEPSFPSLAETAPSVAPAKQLFPVFLEKPDELKPTCPNRDSGPSFIEGPKTPKPKKSKEKEKKRIDDPFSGSEVETDGSEAEMCTSTSSDKTASKKKRKSFGLLGTNPSVAPLDLKMSSTTSSSLLKKSSAKKASSSTTSSSRKGSSGVLNASFVNSSFLAEDLESPPKQHTLRL